MNTLRALTLLASLTVRLLSDALATIWALSKRGLSSTPLFCESTRTTGPTFTGTFCADPDTNGRVVADTECGTPEDVRTHPPITDEDLIDLWRLAADDAAQHRAHLCGGCGDNRGRCRHRWAALNEANGYMDQWLARHGRPA